MKFVYILCALAALTSCSEDCKFRKNYISYKIVGDTSVQGVTPVGVQRAIKKAFSVWEHTILELWFVTDPIYMEELELSIVFRSFRQLFPMERLLQHVGYTEINCTSSGMAFGEETKTIHNATIFLNSDFVYKYNHNNSRNEHIGIDLYLVVLHEVGRALGLHDSNDTQSIMYPSADNFNTFRFNNTEFPYVDLLEINKLYFLRDRNVQKIRKLL